MSTSKPKAPKTSAADRTVDMFAAKPEVQYTPELSADVPELPKAGGDSIEESADRWRSSAMFTSEHMSERWPSEPSRETFRVTVKGDMLFIEKTSTEPGEASKPYSWAGVSFRKESLYELTNVLVAAAKAMKDRERLGIK